MKDHRLCIGCENHGICEYPCESLDKYLRKEEGQPLSGSSLLSSDYMDAAFPDPGGADIIIEDLEGDEKSKRKRRDNRAGAIRRIISLLSKITGEEGKSLKYFFIWKMSVEEHLKHREIAEIMGFSRRRISQILEEIRAYDS